MGMRAIVGKAKLGRDLLLQRDPNVRMSARAGLLGTGISGTMGDGSQCSPQEYTKSLLA